MRRGALMANPEKQVPENVPGEFFVDSTCIDCDACRQIAPSVFGEAAATSFVHTQPMTDDERRWAVRALVCCPTGSIGTRGPNSAKAILNEFPLLVEEPVYYCGFNSPKSFGGNSYFIRDPSGNWLVDSPKYLPHLVRRMERLGGVSRIILTHEDDVADADRYAQRFGANRIIHEAELASQPDAETVIRGGEPVELAPGFLCIPTPGHTAGHCCLLVRDRYLFTGDHLAWDRDSRRLTAFRDYCWYSWERQIESMCELAGFPFEWVLPGHGQRIHLEQKSMRTHMTELVARMQLVA